MENICQPSNNQSLKHSSFEQFFQRCVPISFPIGAPLLQKRLHAGDAPKLARACFVYLCRPILSGTTQPTDVSTYLWLEGSTYENVLSHRITLVSPRHLAKKDQLSLKHLLRKRYDSSPLENNFVGIFENRK